MNNPSCFSPANLQVGFNGRFFPANWRPALDEITFAEQQGFTALQFWGKPEGLQTTHLGSDLTLVAQALKQANITAVMELNIQLTATGLTATGQSPLAFLVNNLPTIRTLGCSCVHCHFTAHPSVQPTEIPQLEAALLPTLAQGVVLAQQAGFRLGFEHNEPDLLLFGQPTSCAATLAAVPGLCFVWDFNHTIPAHLAAFQSLIPRMSMLHLSDTLLPQVNYHLPVGLGNLPFADYFAALRQAGFAGPAILEIGGLPKSGGYGRDTDTALVDSLRRVEQWQELL